MSRKGKVPVKIPDNVTVTCIDNLVSAKGPKGELQWSVPNYIECSLNKDEIVLLAKKPDKNKVRKKVYSQWGLSRAMVNNMIVGVSEGFKYELKVIGTGYKVNYHKSKDFNYLVLSLGYSHDIACEPPSGVTVEVPKLDEIILTGCSKQVVGQFASDIERFKPLTPYHGKGVKIEGKFYVRKKVDK